MRDVRLASTPYTNYKDRVFRMLFREKRALLELYNALNGTAYVQTNDLIVNTLENALFIKMKNDVSFMIDCNMCLYEHQSTFCPNMPLRGFFYLADLYKKLTKDTDLSVRRQICIPTPHYIVFYNGRERVEEEFIQRLSDAYEDGTDGCMELTVRTININLGQNSLLMQKCPTLYGYAVLIAKIRQNLPLFEMREAIERAVDACIEEDILREFLSEQKAEVVAMSIYEYNEEYVRKTFFEDGQEEGRTAGEQKKLLELLIRKIKKGKSFLQAAEELETDASELEPLWNAAERCAPVYDLQSILDILETES